MIGRTNTGGGGASLNFKVVGGTSEPASPKENTIWVNTDTGITSYIFSATEPESPTEGMVWISTGTSSPVAFNALKKNGMQIYPISAKQYVSGAWVEVTAMSYQNGAWVDWVMWIVKDGVIRIGFNTAARVNKPPVVTQYDGYIKVGPYVASSGVSSTAPLCTDVKHDLSDYSTVEFDVDPTSMYTSTDYAKINGCAVYLLPDIGYSDLTNINSAVVASAITKTKGRQTLTLDISNVTGEYYIAISCLSGGSTVGYMNVYNLAVK